MEAFSLLKYWRGGGLVASTPPLNSPNVTSAAATILTAVAENNDESHETDDDDDDGPFFDLEFSAQEASGSNDSTTSGDESDVQVEQDGEEDDVSDIDVEDGEEEGEFNFTVSSGSGNDRTDPNLTMSPSDGLFFKGKLVPIEPDVFNSAEPNSKALFSGSLLKSATKLRVFMSGLKKGKSNTNLNTNGPEKTESTNGLEKTETTNGSKEDQPEEVESKKQNKQGKLFTVKLKVEEVPIVSLFTRDNSSRISTKAAAQNNNNQKSHISEEVSAEEKRFSKEVVLQKYLKMVKPLYVRVSKRKTRLSGQLSVPAEKSQAEEGEVTEAAVSNVRSLKQGNIPAGLRVVCKHLGKSRSASSAVAAAPPGTVLSQRRDDSLLQQQDGIQSAILHCKRSFNASRDSDCTLLPRSVSDSSNENASRKPSDQGREV